MKFPAEYTDMNGGLRPEPNMESFNNVVYTTQNVCLKFQKVQLSELDELEYKVYLNKISGKYGENLEKNSHDNIFYGLIGRDLVKHRMEKVKLFEALKGTKFIRIWDVIFLCYLLGGKITKKIASKFLWITALQLKQACKSEGKIRPKIYQRLWWFTPRKLISSEKRGDKVYKRWKTWFGEKESRHMQNDGKHLACFKLWMFGNRHESLRKATKECHKILTERYGPDYVHQILLNYHNDDNHPNIKLSEGVYNFLL